MEAITLIKDAIHRPDEPRHFMELSHPEGRFVVKAGETVIASTERVMKLSEVGYHIYEPVLYFPVEDCDMENLVQIEKTTHCPLKGDTNYYDLQKSTARAAISEIGWRYTKPLEFAAALEGYIAFDPQLTEIERG